MAAVVATNEEYMIAMDAARIVARAHHAPALPAGRQVGLTAVCLGLVRALDRDGIRFAFAKPIAARGADRVSRPMSLGAHVSPPIRSRARRRTTCSREATTRR